MHDAVNEFKRWFDDHNFYVDVCYDIDTISYLILIEHKKYYDIIRFNDKKEVSVIGYIPFEVIEKFVELVKYLQDQDEIIGFSTRCGVDDNDERLL